MKKRSLFISTLLIVIFSLIVAVFWYQESRYLLPTPVPENYLPVAIGHSVLNNQLLAPLVSKEKPVLLHFFKPHCPCSRFNMKHFSGLVRSYSQQINFIAVLQTGTHKDTQQAASHFKEKYDLNIAVMLDADKKLAAACGIYSTPQAVILNKNGSIYYRGNYNKSRYCTNKNSNFAQMAIDSLLAGNTPPVFIEIATQAYGCELPDTTQQTNINYLFNSL
jgi:peroxiredoxin